MTTERFLTDQEEEIYSALEAAIQSEATEEIAPIIQEHPGIITFQNKLGYNLLHQACLKEKPRVLACMIAAFSKSKADCLKEAVNSTGPRENSPLHFAARLASSEALQSIKLLIQAGADTQALNRDQDFPLNIAVSKDYTAKDEDHDDIKIEKAKQQASQRAIIDAFLLAADTQSIIKARNQNGYSTLCLAVKNNGRNTARWLLKEGANINARNNKGESLLDFAVSKANCETLEFLLKAGAMIDNSDTPSARTSFEMSLSRLGTQYKGSDSEELKIACLLVKRGCKTKKSSNIPVHLDSLREVDQFINTLGQIVRRLCGNLSMDNDSVRYFLETAFKIHATPAFKDQPLLLPVETLKQFMSHQHQSLWDLGLQSILSEDFIKPIYRGRMDIEACLDKIKAQFCHIESLKQLIQNKKIDNSYKGLAICIHNQAIDKIKSAIQNHSSLIRLRDLSGHTPLHLAARWGSLASVECLITAGADPQIRNTKGDIALNIAIRHQHKKIIDYLLLIPEPELIKLSAENIETFDLETLRTGENRNRLGQTTFFIAIKSNDLITARFLLTQGADINTRDSHGASPILVAISQANYKIVEFLLKAGADINPNHELSHTPFQKSLAGFHTSCQNTHSQQLAIACLLARRGCNTEEADRTRMPAYIKKDLLAYIPTLDKIVCILCGHPSMKRNQKRYFLETAFKIHATPAVKDQPVPLTVETLKQFMSEEHLLLWDFGLQRILSEDFIKPIYRNITDIEKCLHNIQTALNEIKSYENISYSPRGP